MDAPNAVLGQVGELVLVLLELENHLSHRTRQLRPSSLQPITTHRVPENNTLELLHLARHRGTHEEALVDFGEIPRAREDRANVFGGVAVGEDEVGFVDDKAVDVFEVECLWRVRRATTMARDESKRTSERR